MWQDRDRGNRGRHSDEGFTRFFINLGKTHKFEPQNLIGLVNEFTRNRNLKIGKIDILQGFSFFEVESAAEKDVLEGFSDAKWNSYQLTVEVSKPKNDSGKRRGDSSSSERRRGISGDGYSKSDRGGGGRRSGFSSNRRSDGGGGERRSSGGENSFKSRFNDNKGGGDRKRRS